ncbi:hypothetical protein EAF04_005515 [Stromatinia cepivora]|nr:hypothetical protein EAF04_005515 [Stromatinia cepivora]
MAVAQTIAQEQVVNYDAREIGRVSYDTTGQLLSPREQARYTLDWTGLAKRYSRPLGKFASVDHQILGNDGKSGLTPQGNNSKSRQSGWKEISDDLDTYQRKRFNGFTASDLHGMQALAALDTNFFLHSLENPIHPCFERSRWVVEDCMPKHKGAIPILGKHEGFWVVMFGFHSGYEDVATGLPRSRTSRNAITRNHTVYDRIEVLISTELAQPLLRDDLTDAEKMGNRLRIATTLVHEFAIWGGQPTSLITQVYNRGGPGLPNLGIIKTSWFTDKNKSYQTSRKAPPLNFKPRRGRIDKFHTYDYWPVPTPWYKTLFTEGFWENVREFGPEAKRMRIEKLGMRFLSKDHPDAKNRVDDSGISIGGGWSYGPPQTRSQTQRFRMKNRLSVTLTKQYDVKKVETYDPLDYLNIKPPVVTYSCPRWDGITEYLFGNRGPLDLALDSMEILSEPTFFRYIRDHGGINLTPMEFRSFLGVANERRELFLWEPFPGFGVVKRIATGWPPPTPGSSILWTSPSSEPDEDNMETLDNLMSDQAVQEALYEYCGECRDLDMETFRKWLVYRFEAEEFDGEDADEDFWVVILETVRQGGIYFTLGPKNIVRFIYPIEDIREKKADEFTKERMKILEERADGLTTGVSLA